MNGTRNTSVKKKDVPPGKYGVCLEFPSEEDRNRFNQIRRRENKKSQTEVALMLMDMYYSRSSSANDTQPIKIAMYIHSGSRRSQRQIISFRGFLVHGPGWSSWIQLSESMAKKLIRDFDCPVGDGEHFVYSHAIDLFYDVDKETYLLWEGISVKAREDRYELVTENEIFEYPLAVSRCKYVKDFDEAFSTFSQYTTDTEFNALSAFLANDIGDDYGIMDNYFNGTVLLD